MIYIQYLVITVSADTVPNFLYMVWDQNLVITVPADALAPNGARPSAVTVLTTKLDMIIF